MAQYGYLARAQVLDTLDTYVQEVMELRPSWGWSNENASQRGGLRKKHSDDSALYGVSAPVIRRER